MKNKKLCLGQVMILVFGIIAISWAVGSEVGVVTAITINGKNYEYGQNVKIVLKDGRTATGTLTTTGNSEYPFGLKDTNRNFIEFTKDNPESQYFNINMVNSFSSYNLPKEPAKTQSPLTEPASDSGFDPSEFGETDDEITSFPEEFKGENIKYDEPSQTASTESDWSWYDHLFGTSGKNTRIYNDKKYYYEEDESGERTWFRTEGGTKTKASDAENTALNKGEGTQPKDFGWESAGSTFLAGVAAAEAAKAGATTIAKAVGTTDEQAEALGEGVRMGIYARTVTKSLMELTGRSGGSAGAWVGGAVALWYILQHYKNVDERSVTFECSVWEAPSGGQNCEKCNNAIFGCSEYQCKSLGEGCELINLGTEEELCAWINRNDATPPKIEVWDDVLDEKYKYTPDDAQSPPDRGVIIKSIEDEEDEQSCVTAYTRLEFGVQLDEPATCKIDVERKDSYEEMDYYFGASTLARYNHTHIMTLPSINAEGTVIQSGSNMSLYVRCEDANGNDNKNDFVFKFCVEEEDDFTAPIIVDTNIPSGSPVAYNISEYDIIAYLNEPSKCKWDFTDKRYDVMENNFSCQNTPIVQNAQTVYSCGATLTGIKDREENKYYFKCNDTSGNTNIESQPKTGFILRGTQPLFIDELSPNNTIVKGAKTPVQVDIEVKTSSGADDGNSYCSYAPIGTTSYVQFLYEDFEMDYQHTQQLNLADGAYLYSIKCVDAGGNAVYETIDFDVETDLSSPIVVRAYKEDNYLKLITDESSECVYNTQRDIGCRYEFDDGVSMQTVEDNEHFIEWDSQETYYIKCKDDFDNPPLYNDCSIIVRPSEGQTL